MADKIKSVIWLVPQHWGTLVPTREGMAHQLPGTASGDSSPKDLHEEQEGNISVTENRQHDSGCLHQPQGGRISKERVALTRDQWMWCLERNIHIQAQCLPGILNQVSDMESMSMTDRSDWKLDCLFSGNQQMLQPTGSGPV